MKGPLLPVLFGVCVAILVAVHVASGEVTTFDSQHHFPCYVLGALAAVPFGYLSHRLLPASVEGETANGARAISGAIWGFLVVAGLAYLAIALIARPGSESPTSVECVGQRSSTGYKGGRRFTELTCTLASGERLTTTDKTNALPLGSFRMNIRRVALGFHTYDPESGVAAHE